MTSLVRTYCMLSNCSRTTFHSSRAFGTNKYKEAKKRRRREDMSWVAPLLERHENPPQIPEEPAKLHMVELVKTTKGRPYWEKRSLQSLGMGEKPKLNSRVVLKNTHSMNQLLQSVKHLLKITPITFPYGPPTEDCDLDKCYLRDNGEFVVVRDVTPASEKPETIPKPDESLWTLDIETVEKANKKTVQNYSLNEEFFREKPVYEHNQDGKEYRYFGDKRNNGQDTWY